MDFESLVESSTLDSIIADFPIASDYFVNVNIDALDFSKTMAEALEDLSDDMFEEFGVTRSEIAAQFADFLKNMTADTPTETIESLTILGGKDKSGADENVTLILKRGEIVSIVGPTGAGKSRLLNDIECLAQRDTPSQRQILINGTPVDDDDRFSLGGKLVAQLSQNMNFVMDLSVGEFLEMHTRSRSVPNPEETVKACFDSANELAGEKFSIDTKVTMLSGGQSRALMIADCAYISRSPVVLIDEIENAGVDRSKALSILAEKEKFVLISTHDPLLALTADKRIVIRNGGISRIFETSQEEKNALSTLISISKTMDDMREKLRYGERVTID